MFVRGPGLKSAIQSVETEFTVDVNNIPGKHLEVDITGILALLAPLYTQLLQRWHVPMFT